MNVGDLVIFPLKDGPFEVDHGVTVSVKWGNYSYPALGVIFSLTPGTDGGEDLCDVGVAPDSLRGRYHRDAGTARLKEAYQEATAYNTRTILNMSSVRKATVHDIILIHFIKTVFGAYKGERPFINYEGPDLSCRYNSLLKALIRDFPAGGSAANTPISTIREEMMVVRREMSAVGEKLDNVLSAVSHPVVATAVNGGGRKKRRTQNYRKKSKRY